MKRTEFNIFWTAVLLMGAGLILFPGASDKWNRFQQSKIIAEYDRTVAHLDTDQTGATVFAAGPNQGNVVRDYVLELGPNGSGQCSRYQRAGNR